MQEAGGGIPRIIVIRGQRVILDRDLACVYGVTTMALNQAVKRNPKRFPDRFLLKVDRKELRALISQNVISKIGRGGATKPPLAFTEHGALMVAAVLNSDRAVAMSIFVIEAFVRMREELAANAFILRRLSEIGPRTPAPGPCKLRLRLFRKIAFAKALTVPFWSKMRRCGICIKSSSRCWFRNLRRTGGRLDLGRMDNWRRWKARGAGDVGYRGRRLNSGGKERPI